MTLTSSPANVYPDEWLLWIFCFHLPEVRRTEAKERVPATEETGTGGVVHWQRRVQRLVLRARMQ